VILAAVYAISIPSAIAADLVPGLEFVAGRAAAKAKRRAQ
jgi:hypothetical protein